jgi:hypothetical protein
MEATGFSHIECFACSVCVCGLAQSGNFDALIFDCSFSISYTFVYVCFPPCSISMRTRGVVKLPYDFGVKALRLS